MENETPKTHDLKLWPAYYEDIETGKKPIDLRIDDRGFVTGDNVRMHEWDPKTMAFTGRKTLKKIKFILRFSELEPGIKNLLGINPSPAAMGDLVALSLTGTHED